jgi:hypothetical protein
VTSRPLAFLAAIPLLALAVTGLSAALPTPVLFDFGSFWESGRAAAAGLDPYATYPLTFRVSIGGFAIENPNLNPPAALPLFDLFARADPHLAFRRWWAVSMAAWIGALALLAARSPGADPWRGVALLWACALAGLWDTLVLGQVYLPLALAAVAAWILLEDRRDLPAGLLIGLLAAVKPNFLVWPVLLAIAGHRRPAAWAGVSFAALSALPAILYGPGVYADWAAVVAGEGARAAFPTNASLMGFVVRAGLPREAGLAIGVALLLGCAAWARRRRPGIVATGSVALTAAILASPIAWVHYLLFLLPVFVAHGGSWAVRAAAALLLVPVPMVLGALGGSTATALGLGSLHGWAAVLLFAGVTGLDRRVLQIGSRLKTGSGIARRMPITSRQGRGT